MIIEAVQKLSRWLKLYSDNFDNLYLYFSIEYVITDDDEILTKTLKSILLLYTSFFNCNGNHGLIFETLNN